MAFVLIRSGVATGLAAALGVLDRRRGTRLYGWVAAIARRHGDHTDFWNRAARKYPADARFLRNTVNAALHAGRIAEAEAAFALLLDSGKARAADSRFVLGLSNADLRRGECSRIRSRVRRFLAVLRGRPDCRIAAVRLNRLIFAHFPRQQRALADAGELRARFLAMLSRSAIKRTPKALLVRAAICEARLEGAYPRSLFHTDVIREQRDAFVSLVRENVARRRPFSFVRVGDGEAACLPYEPRLARHAAADARDRERIWWGKRLAGPDRRTLAARVARAIWDADCIGVPTTGRYLRELNLLREDSLETSLTGRGLRAVLYCSERLAALRAPGLAPPVLVSCHLHQHLALWNCYDSLLHGVKDVVLVSCHPGLADWMVDRFRIGVAANIVLPPDRVSGPLLGRRSADSHDLPRVLDSVVEEIGDSPRGRLMLVGAGYPGKWLVSVARQRGGIALDLGSIFDYWLGLNTRSYLDLDPA